MQQQKLKTKNVASYVLSFSLICVAAALVYFTWQIGLISQQVPDILNSVEKTSEKIEPVVKQVNEIKELIPLIINEVSEIRKQLPAIVNEVEAVRQQVPAILQTTDKASSAIVQASSEIKATRPLVPKILNEVKTTREAIPSMLDRADKLVLNVRKTGKEASKGAVSGMLTGIITAPFELVGSFGKKLFSFSESEVKVLSHKEIELAKQSIHEVLSSDKLNYISSWTSPDSDAHGQAVLLALESINEKPCKKINTKIWKAGKVLTDKKLTACLNRNDIWELHKE